jgi:hypothetical protein
MYSLAAEQDVEADDELARGKSTASQREPANEKWEEQNRVPSSPDRGTISLTLRRSTLFITSTAQRRLRDLKARISAQSKKNFVLERDVRYLDSRIALLIQNRMAADEVGTLTILGWIGPE